MGGMNFTLPARLFDRATGRKSKVFGGNMCAQLLLSLIIARPSEEGSGNPARPHQTPVTSNKSAVMGAREEGIIRSGVYLSRQTPVCRQISRRGPVDCDHLLRRALATSPL